MSDIKTCTKCHRLQSIDQFQKDNSRKDKLQPWCKNCISISNKKYYSTHFRQKKSNSRKWYENNILKLNEQLDNPSKQFKKKKNSALHRGISWELTFEQFMTFWQKPRTYCGIKIKTVGLDRMDSNLGYKLDNCASCCSRCNVSKMDMKPEEFSLWIKQVYTFFAEKFSSSESHYGDEDNDLPIEVN